MRAWENFLKVKGWASEYRSVDNFLGHYKRRLRSECTKELICDSLMFLCKFSVMNPDELVRLPPKRASRLLQDYIDSLADRDYSIRTINVVLAYLKTFFRVNGFKGEREIEVERYHQPARYRKRPEYVPTPDEIYRMAYSAGSQKNKTMILALYTSGLRNSTLRALLYKDVKDEMEKLDAVRIPVYPEMKRVDAGACKGNIPYYSFISREAVNALKEYLDQRRKLYGNVEDDEPLFASTSTNVPLHIRRRTPVKRRTLSEVVKRAAKRAGVERWKDVYPHCLRKAFESALRNSGMDTKDQEFLMGHILPGTQDPYYDYTKIEQLREKYRKIKFFPQEAVSTEEFRKKQVLDTVKLLGFPEDKIKRVEEALAKYETVDDAMDEIRKLSLAGYKLRENPDNDPKKIVDEGELESHLAEGWDVQTVLPSGRILIKKAI